MRRLTAILLLVAFGLPFLSALAFGQDAAAGLPACCRRTGKHHCAMNLGERMHASETSSKDAHFTAPMERCPYAPGVVVAPHRDSLHPPTTAQAVFAGFLSHPSVSPQVESKRRVSRDRSRLKRGPPVLSA